MTKLESHDALQCVLRKLCACLPSRGQLSILTHPSGDYFIFSRIWRMHTPCSHPARTGLRSTVSQTLGQKWKRCDYPGSKVWPFIHVPRHMQKDKWNLKQKYNSFQAGTEPRKGPRPSPLPRAPFSLGILSPESESLSGSNANTGSIVTLRAAAPHALLSARLGLLWVYPIEL